jgi:hypothetical protein
MLEKYIFDKWYYHVRIETKEEYDVLKKIIDKYGTIEQYVKPSWFCIGSCTQSQLLHCKNDRDCDLNVKTILLSDVQDKINNMVKSLNSQISINKNQINSNEKIVWNKWYYKINIHNKEEYQQLYNILHNISKCKVTSSSLSYNTSLLVGTLEEDTPIYCCETINEGVEEITLDELEEKVRYLLTELGVCMYAHESWKYSIVINNKIEDEMLRSCVKNFGSISRNYSDTFPRTYNIGLCSDSTIYITSLYPDKTLPIINLNNIVDKLTELTKKEYKFPDIRIGSSNDSKIMFVCQNNKVVSTKCRN